MKKKKLSEAEKDFLERTIVDNAVVGIKTMFAAKVNEAITDDYDREKDEYIKMLKWYVWPVDFYSMIRTPLFWYLWSMSMILLAIALAILLRGAL